LLEDIFEAEAESFLKLPFKPRPSPGSSGVLKAKDVPSFFVNLPPFPGSASLFPGDLFEAEVEL
jgi:hypothetical protein